MMSNAAHRSVGGSPLMALNFMFIFATCVLLWQVLIMVVYSKIAADLAATKVPLTSAGVTSSVTSLSLKKKAVLPPLVTISMSISFSLLMSLYLISTWISLHSVAFNFFLKQLIPPDRRFAFKTDAGTLQMILAPVFAKLSMLLHVCGLMIARGAASGFATISSPATASIDGAAAGRKTRWILNEKRIRRILCVFNILIQRWIMNMRIVASYNLY
mmetsp:Transcript_4555/g.8782  ORF Transcript_4555/g.8782 Transcript_4555/m.8782 type:complete len:215 (+) Transcript_4555:205-849(+)